MVICIIILKNKSSACGKKAGIGYVYLIDKNKRGGIEL